MNRTHKSVLPIADSQGYQIHHGGGGLSDSKQTLDTACQDELFSSPANTGFMGVSGKDGSQHSASTLLGTSTLPSPNHALFSLSTTPGNHLGATRTPLHRAGEGSLAHWRLNRRLSVTPHPHSPHLFSCSFKMQWQRGCGHDGISRRTHSLN